MKNLSVPSVKQKRLECGPAALRMVLQYFGKDISPKEIAKNVGGIKEYGVRTIDLAAFAQESGFDVHCYSCNKKLSKGKADIKRPKKADITRFLRRKLPVILAVREFLLYHEKPSRMGHFIVITAYGDGTFWYNDPHDGKQHQIDEEDLLFAWFSNALDSSAYLLVLEPKKRRKDDHFTSFVF